MKKTFSFFYSRGGAGIIRGIQMAEYFGAKQNPTEGFEDDICVYVKVRPPDNPSKHSYLDIVDAADKVEYVRDNPKVGIIAQSKIAKKFLEARTGRKDVIWIPEHHCNHERFLRPDRPVTTVGIIGSRESFQLPLLEFEHELNKMGLELLYHEDYWSHYKTGRLSVVDFYKQIDVQVVFRNHPKHKVLSFTNPLKLENAGSFGIPTVSYPEVSYKDEWNNKFIEATSMREMLRHVKRLKVDPAYYQMWQKISSKKAEEYNIEHIAKLYVKYLH